MIWYMDEIKYTPYGSSKKKEGKRKGKGSNSKTESAKKLDHGLSKDFLKKINWIKVYYLKVYTVK